MATFDRKAAGKLTPRRPVQRRTYPADKVREFFAPWVVGEETAEGEQRAYCPLCEDPDTSNSPSASINATSGQWNCQKGEHGGSIVDLVKEVGAEHGLTLDAPVSVAAPAPAVEKPLLPPTMENQEIGSIDWYDMLRQRYPQKLDFLRTERGLTQETIDHFLIGYDGSSQRYTFPIRTGVGGRFRNIRFYQPGGEPKWLPFKGHGSPSMLAYTGELDGNTLPVFVAAGELDAILTNQQMAGNAVAVTGTGGEANVPQDRTALRGREVFVTYDCDTAGKVGAAKMARALKKDGVTVYVLNLARLGLPFTDNHGADLTDYWMKYGGTPEKLLAEMERLRREANDLDAIEHAQKVADQVDWIQVQQEARSLVAAAGWEAPALSGSLAEQLAAPEPDLEFVIDELAFRGANVAVLAQAKSGKTRLNLNVLHSLLSGDALFGHFPVARVPAGQAVAWWNAELSTAQAQRWLREMDFPRPEDFHPLHLRGYSMPFEVQAVEDWAVEWLRSREIKVWSIDPLSALYAGEENSNTEMGAWLAALDRIKRRSGVETLFLVHHVAETSVDGDSDNPNAGRLLKGRGASRLMGWADVLWSYTGRFDEPRYLSALGRDVDVAPFGGLHMLPEGLLRWNGTRTTPQQDRQHARALEAYDIVAAWDQPDPINASQLQEVMKGAKADVKRRGVELAVAQGWINVAAGPGNAKLHTLGSVNPRSLKRSEMGSENQ